MKNGAVINVPSLVKSVKSAVESSSHCTLMEQIKVTRIDYSDTQMIKVSTDKCQTFIGKKVILTPGAYINELLPSLSPIFPYLIQMKIYLYVSTYFKIRDSVHGKDPPCSEWPLWYFFGHPKEHKSDAATDYNLYYGFPSDGDDEEGYARVSLAFTSNEKWIFDNFPPPPDQREVDKNALQFTSCFVQQFMKDLEDTPNPDKTATCIAGFAELTSGQPDAGAGFVLDFVPDTDRRIVLTTGGWGMKFAPLFGKILSDLASEGHTSSNYQDLIHPMNINRGILIKEQVKAKGVTCATEQAAKFHRIWM